MGKQDDPRGRREDKPEPDLGGTAEAPGNPGSGPFSATSMRDVAPYGYYERRGATRYRAGTSRPGTEHAPGEGALAQGGGLGLPYDNLAQAEAAQSDRVDPAARQADEEVRLGAGEAADPGEDTSEPPDAAGGDGGRGELKEEGER
jgi:hypothetical protein